jgi:hypothetical protein
MSFQVAIDVEDMFIKHKPAYTVTAIYFDTKHDKPGSAPTPVGQPVHFSFEITDQEVTKAGGWMGPIGIALAATLRQAGLIHDTPDSQAVKAIVSNVDLKPVVVPPSGKEPV